MSVVWSKIGAFPWPSQKEKNKTSGGTAALFVSVDQQDMVLHCFLLHNQIKMHHFNNHWLTSFGYPRLYVTSQTWDYMSFALSCPWRLWVDSSQMVQCPMLLGQRLRRHGSQGVKESHLWEDVKILLFFQRVGRCSCHVVFWDLPTVGKNRCSNMKSQLWAKHFEGFGQVDLWNSEV